MEQVLLYELEQAKYIDLIKKSFNIDDFALFVKYDNYEALSYFIEKYNLSDKTHMYYDKIIDIVLNNLNFNMIKFFHLKGFIYPENSFSKLFNSRNHDDSLLMSLIQTTVMNLNVDENDLIESVFNFNESVFDYITLHDHVFQKLSNHIDFMKIKHCYEENDNDGFEKNKNQDLNTNFVHKILIFIYKYPYFNFFYERLYMYFLKTYIESYDKYSKKYNEKYYDLFTFVLHFMKKHKVKFKTLFYSLYSNSNDFNIYEKFTFHLLFLYKTCKPFIFDLFYELQNDNLIPFVGIYVNDLRINKSSYFKQILSKNHDISAYILEYEEWQYLIEKYPNIFENNKKIMEYMIYDIQFAFDNILKTGIENKEYINYVLSVFQKILKLLPNLFDSDNYSYMINRIAYHNWFKYGLFDILPEFKEPVAYFKKFLNNHFYMKDQPESVTGRILLSSSINGIQNLLIYILENIENTDYMTKLNYLDKNAKDEIFFFVTRKRTDIFKMAFDILNMKKDLENTKNNKYYFMNDLFNQSDKMIKFFEDEYLTYLIQYVPKLKYTSIVNMFIEYMKNYRVFDKKLIYQLLQKSEKDLPLHLKIILLN